MNKPTPKSSPNPSPRPEGWPVLREEALFGIAGEYIRLCRPYTEADPAAVLAQLYAGFGNLIGDGPFVNLQFTKHHTNIFVGIVGGTAKARKGTSWDVADSLLRDIDQQWHCDKIFGGISTGEGVIAAVGGAVEQQDAADKRALFLESELARVMKAMTRPSNVVSPVLRQAWDHGTLRITTRHNPLIANGAHISFIGHCTKDDLDANLPTLEVSTGLVNRILWFLAYRPHLLPLGAEPPTAEFKRISSELKRAALFAKKQREIKFEPSAQRLWVEEYPALTAEIDGVVGAATARAESQVVRLALICALMNESKEIQKLHLLTALSLWKYAFESARLIFGSRERAPRASKLQAKILALLSEAGATGRSRTEISRALNHHYTSGEIQAALDKLQQQGKAKFGKESGVGRPIERWCAIR